MILLLVYAMLIASGKGAQLGENENCDTNELNLCVASIPKTRIGLPRTKDELDLHCFAYHTGMSCMEPWIKRCLPTDGQKYVQKQIGGARALMRFLCSNETAMQKEYLKESSCWSRVTPDWSRCTDGLKTAIREINNQAQQVMHFNRKAELCCAQDDFSMCVEHAGRSCTKAASTLLRRMAWVLAQDVADCSKQPQAYCSASPPPYATLFTALYGMVMYLPGL